MFILLKKRRQNQGQYVVIEQLKANICVPVSRGGRSANKFR
jgi:hypothetical protein